MFFLRWRWLELVKNEPDDYFVQTVRLLGISGFNRIFLSKGLADSSVLIL
eukprot:UN15035